MAYFDLYRNLSRDRIFSNKVAVISRNLSLAEKEGKSKEIALHLSDLMITCKYNVGLLVPYFFPAYPRNKPMSLFSRPFSFALYGFNIGGSTVVRASRQIGKCLTSVTTVTVRKSDTKDDRVLSTEVGNLFYILSKRGVESI